MSIMVLNLEQMSKEKRKKLLEKLREEEIPFKVKTEDCVKPSEDKEKLLTGLKV